MLALVNYNRTTRSDWSCRASDGALSSETGVMKSLETAAGNYGWPVSTKRARLPPSSPNAKLRIFYDQKIAHLWCNFPLIPAVANWKGQSLFPTRDRIGRQCSRFITRKTLGVIAINSENDSITSTSLSQWPKVNWSWNRWCSVVGEDWTMTDIKYSFSNPYLQRRRQRIARRNKWRISYCTVQ
jgi:hypothetical protein